MSCSKKAVVEYIVLCTAICTVWILLSLPVIFYHIPVTTSNDLNRGGGPPANQTIEDQFMDYFIQTRVNSRGNCSVQCSKDFFCAPGTNSCIPSCTWNENTDLNNILENIGLIFSSALALVFGTLLLVSSCFRRKRMCSFPGVIIIYQTVSSMIMAVVILVGFVDPIKLFCRSNDILLSVRDATPFCVLTGVVLHYLLPFLTLWWLCYVSILFWTLRFPFQARNFRVENRLKYVHIACAIFCFSFSFLPIIVITLNDVRRKANGIPTIGTAGFSVPRFPPFTCAGASQSVFYYSFILPINIIVAVGVTLLILVTWLIYMARNSTVNDEMGKVSIKVGTAEKKTFVLLCYYVVVSVLGLTGITINARTGLDFSRQELFYFSCESDGQNFDEPCERDGFERFNTTALVIVSFILIGMIPLVNFILTINYGEVLRILKHCNRCSVAEMEVSSRSSTTKYSTNEPNVVISRQETKTSIL